MSLKQPDIKELQAIVDWVNLSEDVREVSLKYGDIELFVSRDRHRAAVVAAPAHAPAVQPVPAAQSAPAPATSAPSASAPAPEPNPGESVTASGVPTPTSAPADDEVLVKAPMVGIFYASPKPGDPPFVRVGDSVEAGAVLGIVEVMKLMSNLEAEFAGTVVKVLAGNEQAVEYGQPLMVIKRNV